MDKSYISNEYDTRISDERFLTHDNITEIKKMKEQLDFQAYILSNIQDAVCAVDKNFQITYWNGVAEKMFGWTAREAIGRPSKDIFRMVSPSNREDSIARLIKNNGYTGEAIYKKKNGEEISTYVVCSVIRGIQGEYLGNVSTITDITERKNIEQSLLESEERYRGVVQNTSAAVLRVDLKGIISFVNRRVVELFGYSEDELVGKYIVDTIVPRKETSGRDMVDMIEAILADPDSFYVNAHENMCKDGKRIWMEWTNSGIYDDYGRLSGYLAVGIDASVRKKAEEALRESEERYRRLHETLRDPFVQTDMDGRIIDFNDLYSQMLGYTPQEIYALTYQELTPAHWHAYEEQIVRQQIIPRGYSNVYEKEYRRKDGTIIAVELRAILSCDNAGRPKAMWAIVHNITNRKQTEKALRESEQKAIALVAELEKADRSKNQFISVLSHELRNPLAAISAGIQVLEITKDTNQAANVKEIINRQTKQLCKLVDDLLEMTRINQNKIKLKKEYTNLNEVLKNAAEDSRLEFKKKGVIFTTKIQTKPIFLNVDPVRITQAIGNILINALKFTEANGTVLLKLKTEKNNAVISVEDNGIGMSTELLTDLFTPFTQADNSMDRSGSGLGLGLSIVKSIMDLHEGNVSAYSDGLGKGSTFTIRLPIMTEESLMTENVVSNNTNKKSLELLIIEDNKDFADLLSTMLSTIGHNVNVAFDGKEGVKLAKQIKPDVIFCDIGLPGMDGFVVAGIIKNNVELKDIYLIALSGYAGESDVERVLKAGFDKHLAKPVDLKTLQNVL